MNRAIPYLLCWCLCATVAAQTSNVDSLEQALASVKGNSFERGKLLLEISQEYRFADTAKSRMYIMEALKLSKKTGLERIERASCHAMGLYYIIANQPYLAHVYYKMAEKLCLKNNEKNYLCAIYNDLKTMFFSINDMDNVAYYSEKLLETVAEGRNLSEMTPSEISEINNGPYDLTVLIFEAQFFKGMARYQDEESQEALDFFEDLFRKSELLNVKSYYCKYNTIACGDLLLRLNRPREALRYLHLIREDYEEDFHPDNSNIMFMEYAFLAEAYAMLHRLDSADYYLKKALDSSFEDSRTNQLYIQYQALSTIETAKGDYRNALNHYRKFHHITDSIAKEGKTMDIARLKNWYELEQKDNENLILQQEGQKQHRLILILEGTLVMIFALLAFSLFFYRKTAEKNRELKKLNTVKDKLFSIVAHDLRNPMGALMSVLKLANKNMLDAETQAQLLKDISIRVDDTYNLLDNLLRWSKSQMQGMIPVPVYFDAQAESRAVTNTLQSFAMSKMITLNNQIEMQQVYVDRDMFAVIVRNLTMNAIKYTSAEGTVTLASELSENKFIISVKDTGTGMTQEVQNQLFKFSETKSRRGTNNESGTGLGLVLCADFVKINGGNIWFYSRQEEGSTFFFSLPVKGS